MSIARRALAIVSAVALFLGLLAGALSAAPSADAAAWTYRTATVKVGGTTYTVDVALSSRDARRVNGAVQIAVASSGRASLGSDDGGFSDRGYRVSSSRGTGVTFTVTIPARGNVSAEVGISSAGGAISGPATTNTPLVIVVAR
jgi:hypothetical protein